MNEREIKVRDLFWYIISKWKILVIIIIIGAIIGGGYSYYKSSLKTEEPKAHIDQLAEKEDVKDKELIDAVSGLSPEEGAYSIGSVLTEADVNNINMYYYYKDLYDARKNNSDSLEYMALDPYNAYEGRYLYFVKSASFDALDSILATYKTNLNDLKEIYGTLFYYSTESYSVANPSLSSVDSMQFESPTGTLAITVYGDSKEKCMEKLEAIDEYIIDMDKEIESGIVDHELKRIAESCYKVQDTTILDMQKNNIDALNTINNSMNTTYKNLSAEAKAFVRQINANPELNWEEILATASGASGSASLTDDKEAVNNNDVENTRKVSGKWVAAGAVIGFVIVIIILAIVYCSSNKVRFEDDLETILGVPCLGLTRAGDKKRKIGLDKAIEKARYKYTPVIDDDSAADMIAANLAVCAADKKAKTIWATGTSLSENGIKLADSISAVLRDKGIEMTVGHSLYTSAKEIEKMADADAIVLFENIYNSKNTDVRKAIKSCAERGIKTLGVVIGS